MNVFSNEYNAVWDIFEGKSLLEQANVPIEAETPFDFHRTHCEEWVMRGRLTWGYASFKAPMWFIRGVRKHFPVVNYSVSGCVDGKWVHTFDNATKVEPWHTGWKQLDISLGVKLNGVLVFFDTRA